jgi:hypothetical protein
MPIEDHHLDPKFIHVTQDQTVAEALEALNARGGTDNWHFFVAREGGGFGVLKVVRLKEQLAQLGPALFDIVFSQLIGPVPEGRVVQQQQMGIGTAERWALNAPERVLVVMRDEEIAGRLYMAARSSDPFPGSNMGQLYGDYISTHLDARSQWRPVGTEPPTCPHCGHVGFYRYRASDKKQYCDNCGESIL